MFLIYFLDVCDKYCDNEGVCVKDIKGQPSCRCIGSFTGKHCTEKSEFAYIAGGIAGGVIFIILIILLVWMICARYVRFFWFGLLQCFEIFLMFNFYIGHREEKNRRKSCNTQPIKMDLKSISIMALLLPMRNRLLHLIIQRMLIIMTTKKMVGRCLIFTMRLTWKVGVKNYSFKGFDRNY